MSKQLLSIAIEQLQALADKEERRNERLTLLGVINILNIVKGG